MLTSTAQKLSGEIQSLTDVEKLRLVDAILADLNKPNPVMDRIWAKESRKSWAAYKSGHIRQYPIMRLWISIAHETPGGRKKRGETIGLLWGHENRLPTRLPFIEPRG